MNVLIAGLVLLGAAITAAAVSHALRCEALRCRCWLPVRWVAGKSLNGHTVTNATFLRDASKVLPRTGNCSPFQKLAGWKRVAWRNGPALLAMTALAAWAAGSILVLAATGAVTGIAGGWMVFRRTASGRRRLKALGSRLAALSAPRLLHRLTWRGRKQSMAMLLSTITGTAAATVEAGVKWNPHYATAEPGEEVARWVLPRGFKATAGEKALAMEVWQSRIGFEVTPSWQLDAAEPVLVMKRAFQLPKLVYLHEVLEKVEALPESRTAIGVDDQGELVCWDWATENPHGLLNAGSRHGKTETEEGMVAQVLRKGGTVTYIDVKRVSIQGMKGLPGLTLCDNPRDMVGIWTAIQAWGDELDARVDARTKDPTIDFPRSLLVLEEVNQLSEMFDEFWENWPAEDEAWRDTIFWKPRNAKRTPAIWRVVKKGVWEGAFCKKNVLIAGQNVEAQTVRGIRNSIGMRLLGGYQPQNWKALVGTTPAPPAPPVKGRWCLVNGSAQTWVQAIVADLDANASAAIWRDYARAGRRLDGSLPATGNSPVTYHVDSNGQVSAVNAASAELVTAEMGLSDIVAAGLVQGTLKALRMDRHRSDIGELPDGLKFPEPVRLEGQKEIFSVAEVQAFDVARRSKAPF